MGVPDVWFKKACQYAIGHQDLRFVTFCDFSKASVKICGHSWRVGYYHNTKKRRPKYRNRKYEEEYESSDTPHIIVRL